MLAEGYVTLVKYLHIELEKAHVAVGWLAGVPICYG